MRRRRLAATTDPEVGQSPSRGLARSDGGARTVAVYLHVATIGRYQEVLEEVLNALASSPVAAMSPDVQVHVVGDGEVALERLPPWARVIRTGEPVTAYEMPTLRAIHADARAERSWAVLYLNCLGGRHVGSGYEIRRAWRELIGHELLQEGARRLAQLESSELVGIEWAEQPLPHMTSNNWWASAAYAARLADPVEFAETVVERDLARYGPNFADAAAKRRHAGEFWIGSGHPRSPTSCFPLSRSGLPKSALGIVPWWGLPGIEWGRLARRMRRSKGRGAGHNLQVAYYQALFAGRAISRALKRLARRV